MMNYCFYMDFLKQQQSNLLFRKLGVIKMEYAATNNLVFSVYSIKKNNKYQSKSYFQNSQSKKFKNIDAQILETQKIVFIIWNQYLDQKQKYKTDMLIESQIKKKQNEQVLAVVDHTFLNILKSDSYIPEKFQIRIHLEQNIYYWGDYIIKTIEIPERGTIFICYYELGFLYLPKNGKIRVEQYFTSILQNLFDGVKEESPKILLQKFEVSINNLFQNNPQYLISKQKKEKIQQPKSKLIQKQKYEQKLKSQHKQGQIRYDWLEKSLIIKCLKDLYG